MRVTGPITAAVTVAAVAAGVVVGVLGGSGASGAVPGRAAGTPATGAVSGAVTRVASGAVTGATSDVARIQVVASGLDQPKKVTVAPGGTLLVAASGDGAAPSSCVNGAQRSCLDSSGAIERITIGGQVSPLLGGLPSVSSGATAGVAAGPAEARIVGGRLVVLFQDQDITHSTGRQPYGPGGRVLGELVRYGGKRGSTGSGGTAGSGRAIASFGPFEARHNPDHDAGTDVALGLEPGIDSDPYAFVPYRGGYAVVDAGANDLLFVARTGAVRVLAVFPTITETAAPGSFGPSQKRVITARAQPVPDSLAVGPDGALYVGELSGTPYDVGSSRVYRVVPGRPASVYARGLTSIADIAFDSSGRLLVLEIDRRGLRDPALLAGSTPASGALIEIAPAGLRRTVVSSGLEFPTGMAFANDGSLYIAVRGIDSPLPGSAGGGGALVRVTASGL